MQAKLTPLLEFLTRCWQQRPDPKPQVGKPPTYSAMSFVLFFMLMVVKGIPAFKAMHRWAQAHHACLGWEQAPDRATIRRRFLALPAVVQTLMPAIARHCQQLDHATFGYACSFADKSVFRSLGGLWHRKQRLLGRVPHPSIDTQASWAKSDYHGWRYGYSLHLLSNGHRFPLVALVTTAATKDYHLLEGLVAPLAGRLGVVVADSGYFAARFLQAIHHHFSVLVATPCLFKAGTRRLSTFQQYYNDLVGSWAGRLTYRRRKPSVEPVFALVKELTGLSRERQLPYRGVARVRAYLLVSTCLLQLIMYDNFIHHRELGTLRPFKEAFL